MNIALLGKLGWRLLNTTDGLWVTILRTKFRVGETEDLSWLEARGTWSPTWRSVVQGIREVVVPGMAWVLGDGGKVRFWRDKWLIKEPLSMVSRVEVPEELVEKRARQLWQTGTGWLWEEIEPYMSPSNCLRLASVVINEVTGVRDRISWGESTDGMFTVKSAYTLLTRSMVPRPSMEALYKRVWSVMTPERVRVFLWLVTHQVIMTNMERKRRHLSETSVCPLCKGGDETIILVLRDCPAAMGLWKKLVSRTRQQRFFQLPLLTWLFENLERKPELGDSWPTIFALTVWWCWKWRCGYVFGDEGKCRDRVSFLKEKTREVITANERLRDRNQNRNRVEMQIAWQRPAHGWIKLNTDGAAKGNPGLATAGGVMRDEFGVWQGGFAVKIGLCSAPLAELWGVYYGLCIAWDRGFRRLELEVDSESVVGFLQTRINNSHPLSFLVHLCYAFISRDWLVKISHVYREANRLADGLANYASSLLFGGHVFEFVPDSVSAIELEDTNGVSRPRQVCL